MQTEFDTFPGAKNARKWGLRALLTVPSIREGTAIGVIALRRREAELFTGKQVLLRLTRSPVHTPRSKSPCHAQVHFRPSQLRMPNGYVCIFPIVSFCCTDL